MKAFKSCAKKTYNKNKTDNAKACFTLATKLQGHASAKKSILIREFSHGPGTHDKAESRNLLLTTNINEHKLAWKTLGK